MWPSSLWTKRDESSSGARSATHPRSHATALGGPARSSVFPATGGTGFVGTWLLESLLWVSDQLNLAVAVVRPRPATPIVSHRALRTSRVTGRSFCCRLTSNRLSFRVDRVSCCDPRAHERIREPSQHEPLGSFDPDVAGTQRVLEFARLHGIRRLLFTSSGAVYGRQPPDLTHIPEDYMAAPSTLDTASVYGQAKRMSEFMCASYGRTFQFDVLIARLFALRDCSFPGPNYVVGNFIRDAIAGGPIRIAGVRHTPPLVSTPASQTIRRWHVSFCGQPALPYNVGSSISMTIAELAGLVIRATDSSAGIEIARRPIWGAPPVRYVPATHRAQRDLGLHARYFGRGWCLMMSNWYRGIQ